MPEEPVEVGRFAFGIKVVKHADGSIEFRTQSANENVPVEIVIMLLRAFLRNLENDYFDNYDKSVAKFGKG